ncbi:guanylate kinase [soil metagenome]
MNLVSDRGVLVIVSSPSGAGKTTLTRRLITEFRPQLEFSISYTTRSMRPGEVNGRDYFFVTPAKFEAMVQAGEFAEDALVFGNRYGTAQGQIDHALDAGHDIIFDVDWQGGDALAKRWPQDSVKIFILPPDMATLEARLRSRATDSADVIERRIRKAKDELGHYPEYQHLIVNDELEHAYDALRATYLTRRYGSVDRADISHPLAALAAKVSDPTAAIAHARALLS